MKILIILIIIIMGEVNWKYQTDNVNFLFVYQIPDI